jgi:PAS domain-containing protein
MDWQSFRKEVWESITFSSVSKAVWGAAGTLVAIYWKKNGGEFTKSLRGFFKSGTLISSLQATIKQNTERIDELHTQVYISNAEHMALAYCAPDAIFFNNEKGEVIFVNPAWLAMTGMPTVKDAYGFGYHRVIHKESLEFVKENTKSLIEHPGSFDNYIIFQHYHTRAKITTLCRSEPIFDDKGVLKKHIGRVTVISIEEYQKEVKSNP